MGNIFNLFIVNPLLNALLLIYHVLAMLHIPYALGFAIISLTVLVRILLYPLTMSQLRTSLKMQKITPHLNKLKEQHKGNPQRLQQETMSLYKEHGVNPASGCLLLIVQFPLLWGLYAVLQEAIKLKPHEAIAVINKIAYTPSLHLQKPWDTTFFGLPLGQAPSHLFSTVGIVILLIPLVTGILQFVQSKMMMGTSVPAQKTEKKEGKKENENEFAQAMQTQTLYFLPVMIGYFSYVFPSGLSLYWNTFSIFGIIQQYLLQRGDKEPTPVTPKLPMQKKKKK
jgi:YidC/Oxa1 family membrane protein insertase